ncbi:unnamed protein product, partial [Didymodactylos carnosus]
CVDLWICAVVIPCIAIMEYNEFNVNTSLCRFYSFSKIIIIISSFIMSAIAFDRFFIIAFPHHRVMTPHLIKILLTIVVLIALCLGILISLAFSTQKWSNIILNFDKNTTIYFNLPFDQTKSIINLNYTHIENYSRCFSDTTIITERVRDTLKRVTNIIFFILVVIVSILYTATYILALRRQAPRLRALKKNIYILDRYASVQKQLISFSSECLYDRQTSGKTMPMIREHVSINELELNSKSFSETIPSTQQQYKNKV